VGDASPAPGAMFHWINVEGTVTVPRFISTGQPGSASRHTTRTVVVEVTDGALTVDALGGRNTKINYLEVVPVEAP
jgi:hypothetical protein